MNTTYLETFKTIFDAIYKKFYNEGYRSELVDEYEDAVASKNFKRALLDFCQYRRDALASDRECAAFYATYETMKYIENFNR